jgi:TolA-binding protein
MKNSLKSLFLLAVPFVFAACPTLMTRNDVKEVEQKKAIESNVSNLQKTTADVANRFSELEEDNRLLNGRIEELEKKLRQSKETSETQHRQQEDKVSALRDQVQGLQQDLVRIESELIKTNAALEAGVSQKVPEKNEKDDPFESAEKLFEAKDWKKAILAYNKYRDNFPKGKRFPEVTYKIGVCFQELGMKDEARSFYEEVISKFSSSPEARKSKTRLKGLK